jgi:hypothetical protein
MYVTVRYLNIIVDDLAGGGVHALQVLVPTNAANLVSMLYNLSSLSLTQCHIKLECFHKFLVIISLAA